MERLLENWLTAIWWRPPGPAAWLLWPLSIVYRALAALDRWRARPPGSVPVPVIVVGNVVVGGVGKTPIVMATVRALQAAGRHPGVISRGFGRRAPAGRAGDGVREVKPSDMPGETGDEPLLIRRRCGVPVYVGRRRVAAARALCAAHPEVDVLVSDDGLQHHALPRAAQIIVFDDRGVGNGLLLPAGPLRQPLPRHLPSHTWIAYTGRRRSTPLEGIFVPRAASRALPFEDWAAGAANGGQPLADLRGRPLVALAGIGAPEQFFAMLEAAGLTIERLARPDHAEHAHAPWPPGTREVITTEKDAVKLAALPRSGIALWVVPLDCELPDDLARSLIAALPHATQPS